MQHMCRTFPALQYIKGYKALSFSPLIPSQLPFPEPRGIFLSDGITKGWANSSASTWLQTEAFYLMEEEVFTLL